jgi:hypothetical protein
MGSRGQSGRDKDAGEIVKEYSMESIGRNKKKILDFFRELDGTDEQDVADRFRENASDLADELSESMVYRDDDARDEYNRMASNSSGGFRFENVSSADVRRMQDDYNKSLRDTTDYELGVGVPWGNREYRQGARRNRLSNRSQKRRG